MTSRTVAALALLCALLVGALARDLIVPQARADTDAIRRSDVDRVVRALEQNAKANQEVAREIEELGRRCK